MTRFVALGGGHGTAVTLRAALAAKFSVTGIVSVADNGGSTGRLREILDVAAVGDIRKCLVALADDDNLLAANFEHRFMRGELRGHAVGNLLLAGLIETASSLEEAIAIVSDSLKIRGRVIPASREGVELLAVTDTGVAEGQTSVSSSTRIRRVAVRPASARAPRAAVEAIAEADLIIYGPGSIFSSVLAACVVPGITEALSEASAPKYLVVNLYPQFPESENFELSDYIDSFQAHGVALDGLIVDSQCLPEDFDARGLTIIRADVRSNGGRVHDSGLLARTLAQLVP
jgi:uncharacterized cofD-like protein